MSHDRTPVRHQIVESSFGFYTEQEIEKLSVKQITSPQAYDSLRNPLPGGLYDPALGPTEFGEICPTCGCNQQSCPGHLGRIKLHVPVYHPLLMPLLFKLIRAKCMFCHRFRLHGSLIRLFRTKIQLTDIGKVKAAMLLDELVAREQKESKEDGYRSLVRVLDKYDFIISEAKKPQNMGKAPALCGSKHARAFRRQVVGEFLKLINNKKCAYCKGISPGLRMDAHNKIFQKRLPVASRRSNSARQLGAVQYLSAALQTKPANEETLKDGDDSDNPEEQDAKEGGGAIVLEADKYLHPTEVKMQMEELWKKESEVLSVIIGNATGRPTTLDKDAWKVFFVDTLAVPPSRFRPPMVVGEILAENPQNVTLAQVLTLNERLVNIRALGMSKEDSEEMGNASDKVLTSNQISRMASTWIELQTAVNVYMDNSKQPGLGANNDGPTGIKQLLERKEGLFRKHMMGKRVNYACRSVISPDPYIGAGEIGLPLRFAKELTFPEPVTSWNVVKLRNLVEKGPENYPGANFVEDKKGRMLDLSRLNTTKRKAVAARLLSQTGQKVWRQLVSGDVVLMNRQPTLHKPGIMAHKVRVLSSPEMQTIRMHYANCNTYNADFDGDEMNCHFPQDQIGRAEAYNIASTEAQYIVPTDGTPIRGLIQDHVCSGVKLTSKNTFLDKEEYQHLVVSALTGLPGLEIVPTGKRLQALQPTILKPKQLWTGKQVVSTVLKHLTAGRPQLSMDGKAKTSPVAFGFEQKEDQIIVRDSQLLTGVLDKGSFGASQFGLVHSVYEMYGPAAAAHLLTAFGRLFTIYLQFAGHTCGIEDLMLTKGADAKRRELIDRALRVGKRATQQFCLKGMEGSEDLKEKADIEMTPEEIDDTRRRTEAYLAEGDTANKGAVLDSFMQGTLAPFASDIIKACLPTGLEKHFPANAFSLMVVTGAKGSTVNQSQITCGLGQQALEGRRVPLMSSGKTLPSFEPFDPNPRAGGFITDRFLTGVKPQEYYFHCMAGREGLVDTAVKTSRSGYLQRCLIKHLEELTVAYDHTVRDAEGGVVQFLYGEDGVDTVKGKYLGSNQKEMQFIASNYKGYVHKYAVPKDLVSQSSSASQLHKAVKKATSQQSNQPFAEGSHVLARQLQPGKKHWKRKNLRPGFVEAQVTKATHDGKRWTYDLLYRDGTSSQVPQRTKIKSTLHKNSVIGKYLQLVKAKNVDPVLGKLNIGNDFGAVSESVENSINAFIQNDSEGFCADSDKENQRPDAIPTDKLRALVWTKYMHSLVQPGEAVGSIAAQSVGEPSTQMTLNTFHLAGHGGANVTLGIPRLREIIMTASQSIKTPTVTVPLKGGFPKIAAEAVARRLSRLPLSELLSPQGGIQVTEQLRRGAGKFWERQYLVKLCLVDLESIRLGFAMDFSEIATAVKKTFIARLLRLINTELRRSGETTFCAPQTKSKVEDEAKEEEEDSNSAPKKKKKKKNGKDYDEEDDDNEEAQGTLKFGRKKEVSGYGEMDEEDLEVQAQTTAADAQESDEEEDDGNTKKEEKKEDEVVSDTIQKNKHYGGITEDKSGQAITILLMFPASSRRLLMLGLAEQAATQTLVRSSDGITRSFVMEKEVNGETRPAVGTEGSKFSTIWNLGDEILDLNNLSSNDIWAIRQTYGVEAARQAIVQEITGVFGVYGISVDPRHLGLLADYMTYDGGYCPLNRGGMADVGSPFLQMSFETTCQFLLQASVDGRSDKLQSPSARIVMGQVPRAGTGCFDLMMPVTKF